MQKKLKNKFTKYFCMLMVLMLLAMPLCVSASAYDYNGTQLELHVTGFAGGDFGEEFHFLGDDILHIDGSYPMQHTFTTLVYQYYYGDTAFGGYKQEVYEYIADDISGFDFNDYYPVIIVDEFYPTDLEHAHYEAHAITGVCGYNYNIHYYTTELIYGNTVTVLGNDFNGGELNYLGEYIEVNSAEAIEITCHYLLIPIDSPFFKQWCPYDFSDYADLVTVYNSGYDEGVADTKALFDNSYYGLLYNSIGELVYGDVGELTETQALVLNLVSMVLSLVIIVVPIIVLLLVVKLVMRR